MAEAILTKVGLQALGLPYFNAKGETENPTVPYNPTQLIAAGRLFLSVERKNQIDEHRRDRMEFRERALECGEAARRAKANMFSGIGGGKSRTGSVKIYKPGNGSGAPPPG